jgi:hypothetical protein
MDLKLNNPDAFAFDKKDDGSIRVALPSAGASLFLEASESDLLYKETERFFKETIAHSDYVMKRFNAQHGFLASHIQALISRGCWTLDGFTEKSLSSKGNGFLYDAEQLLENMMGVFCSNKKLHAFSKDEEVELVFPSTLVLTQWPSIIRAASLSCVEEEDYKGKWDVPLRFTSSGTLAGMVMPIIFHEEKLDISLNGGRVKLYTKGEDATALLEHCMDKDNLAEFNVAKQAWQGLAVFEKGSRRYLQKIKSNGYDSDLGFFNYEDLNIDEVHNALLELHNGLASEESMKAINAIFD